MELCVANETRAIGIDKEITAEFATPSPCPLPAKEREHRTAISLPISGALGGARAGDLPGLVVAGGPAAQFAWEEFLFGRIRNEHTRRAYGRAVGRFLAWCQGRGLDLPRIAPRDVGVYLDLMPGSAPTKKLHLAALRHFFDQLVTQHAVILNPAACQRD
jgi:hypothetical protein